MAVASRALLELDTCVGSLAKPAKAYAETIVETSFTVMNSLVPGQLSTGATSVIAEFVPEPESPPTA